MMNFQMITLYIINYNKNEIQGSEKNTAVRKPLKGKSEELKEENL